MVNYKLSNAAKDDLIRLLHYGVQNFGETLADLYFYAFFDQFHKIAVQTYLFPAVVCSAKNSSLKTS